MQIEQIRDQQHPNANSVTWTLQFSNVEISIEHVEILIEYIEIPLQKRLSSI